MLTTFNCYQRLQRCSWNSLYGYGWQPCNATCRSALHKALYLGHVAAAAVLLHASASTECCDRQGRQPMDLLSVCLKKWLQTTATDGIEHADAADSGSCNSVVYSWGNGANYQLGTGEGLQTAVTRVLYMLPVAASYQQTCVCCPRCSRHHIQEACDAVNLMAQPSHQLHRWLALPVLLQDEQLPCTVFTSHQSLTAPWHCCSCHQLSVPAHIIMQVPQTSTCHLCVLMPCLVIM